MDKFVEFEYGQKFVNKKIENQAISNSADDFHDAGYILKSDDFIVDIDNLPKDTIQKLIDTFNIKTQIVWTDRGAHLYFKKSGMFKRSRGVCALGFPVEYKHYDNCYAITIKRNGEMRKIENPGVRDPLPKFLETIPTRRSLIGMDEGDGRNEALYEHKKKISRFGNVPKILDFINRNIFSEPLDEKEFLTVSREEVLQAEKDGENMIAERIIKEKRVRLFKNSLYFFDGVTYSNDENELNRMVYEYCPDQKTRYVKEVIEQLKFKAEVIPDDTEFKIMLKNGYLFDGEFYPYKYDDFTPYYIPIDYHANAEPVEAVDNYLEKLTLGDESYKKFLLEIIASCLIVNKEFKRAFSKFFIFHGTGGNGKGTLLQIIKTILGEKNVSAASITELGDERYLNNLIGKLANLGDDMENEPINRKQMKILKNLSSGDLIQVRRLNENAFMTSLNPVLIFTTNHLLKSFDKDLSYKRRVIWCPMDCKIKESEIDVRFISKLTTPEALEYWIKLVIEAYRRLYKQEKFTYCKKVKDFTKFYHRENDSTIEYLETVPDEDIFMRRTPTVYDDYEAWCENNGETPQAPKRLKEQILERGFIIKRIKRKDINGGKDCKVYYKAELDTKD